ncbi:MAG: PspA/IM30 family protein [Cytophagales bacterium]|nr:PspA/IM30 family protein [Armatimonadota bacterium]
MLKRFWNLIKSLFGAGLDKLEDPELLLSQAQTEMREMHAKNRERAVQAITQKNNLQQMVDDTQKRVDMLQGKAELALKRGDRDLALQLLKEKQQFEVTLSATRESLNQAIETSEAVKTAIKREEERIRQKTAEALALKAQWKNSQIQIAMNKALDGMQGIDDTEQSFGRAQAKIKNATSEMMARSELAKQKVENRMSELDVAEGDVAAESELAALESKLGLGSTPVPQTTVKAATGGESDIERQLAELEAKVGGGGGTGSGS